ncbi:MAG TPA: hypothetical protein VKC65_01565 [Gaiellaceae bacterium]|nr:hypothetical protein [Gaiellaceae bacterium]
MFRFFAVLLVVGAFVGALYFSGDALEAWESPQPETVAMPKLPKHKKQRRQKRHARPAKPAQPVKQVSHAKPSWLVELNATCRRGKRESESIPPASTPQEVPSRLKQVIRLNKRMNRETAELVSRSGNAAATANLRTLYAQDEALLQRVLNAAEQRRYQRLAAMGQSLLAVAKAENDVFARLGAHGCTVSPDELRL